MWNLDCFLVIFRIPFKVHNSNQHVRKICESNCQIAGETLAGKDKEVCSVSTTKSSEQEREGVVRKGDFEELAILGIGSFGRVALVRKKSTQNLYALKQILKEGLTEKIQTRIVTERNVMALHTHQFVVQMHYAFQDSEKVYMVMDYCEGGDLNFHLRRKNVPTVAAKFIVAQVVLALGHLHEHGFIYRDLKPENVLFCKDGYVKLADFGLAKEGVFSATSGAKSLCGSFPYLSPEILMVFQGLEEFEYGYATDYWSLGILLFEILFGVTPWYGKERQDLALRIQSNHLVFPDQLPYSTSDFITKLLSKRAADRIGSCGNEEVKSHSYFKNVSWENLLDRKYAPSFIPIIHAGDTSKFDTTFSLVPVQSVGGEQTLNVDTKMIKDFDF